MKILFILRDLDVYEPFGIMQLSSILKEAGHNVDLVNAEYQNVVDYAKTFKPDIFAYSTSTAHVKFYIDTNKILKKHFPDTYSIFGGAHPTFYPEIIEEEGIDAICIGEGDRPFAQFLDSFGSPGMFKTPNFWIKENGTIHKNDISPLIEDLDSLPFLDTDIIYAKDKYFQRTTLRNFMASRGCPYNCTYCFNHVYKELYKNKGRYLRTKSPDYFIEEIQRVRRKYPLKFIKFADDIFILNREWLREFAPKYASSINLPYHCWTRANHIDDETCRLLKESGCVSTNFAIESGNETLRNQVLGRNMSDETIINAANCLRKYGIIYGTHNMIGIPGETIQDIYKTVALNIKVKSSCAWVSLFQPYPKLKLSDYAINKGYFDGNYNLLPDSDHITTPLNFKPDEKKKIVNLHRFFALLVEYPFLRKPINFLIQLPPNKLFWIFHTLFYSLTVKRRLYKKYHVSLREAVRSFKQFLKHVS